MDFMASACQVLGINPLKKNLIRGERPVGIVNKGANPIKELI
jgi:hypothetical protein